MKHGEFWNVKVPQAWRHIISAMPDDKKKRILKRVNDNLFSKLDFSIIKEALDWGCGGGLLAKELSNFCNVSVVDISEHSIQSAIKYASSIQYKQIIENIDEFVYAGNKPDLIFSNEVIQHFPSLEYFNKVLNIWIALRPTYFALQIKLGTTTKEVLEYYEKSNYLNGLVFEENTFIQYFIKNQYALIAKSKEIAKNSDAILGYYIFKNEIIK